MAIDGGSQGTGWSIAVLRLLITLPAIQAEGSIAVALDLRSCPRARPSRRRSARMDPLRQFWRPFSASPAGDVAQRYPVESESAHASPPSSLWHPPRHCADLIILLSSAVKNAVLGLNSLPRSAADPAGSHQFEDMYITSRPAVHAQASTNRSCGLVQAPKYRSRCVVRPAGHGQVRCNSLITDHYQ
jgi:hypothetical protein